MVVVVVVVVEVVVVVVLVVSSSTNVAAITDFLTGVFLLASVCNVVTVFCGRLTHCSCSVIY